MPKGQFRRPTKEEGEARIEEGAQWMLENPDAGFMDFMNVFCDKWGIQRDSCNRWRKKCLKRIGESSSTDVESAKRLAVASMSRMIRMAMDNNDYKLAFQIRQEMNKVTGAHAPIRTEVVQKEDKPIFKIDLNEDDSKLKKVD